MQLDYLLVIYSLSFDCLIVNQMTKEKRKIERARKASELVSPFQRRGMGKSRRYEKVHMNSYYIFMGRARFPHCQRRGCGGLQSPFACPERAGLSKYTFFWRAFRRARYPISNAYGIILSSKIKSRRKLELPAAKLEKMQTSTTPVVRKNHSIFTIKNQAKNPRNSGVLKIHDSKKSLENRVYRLYLLHGRGGFYA
jgi:hypothetical protein